MGKMSLGVHRQGDAAWEIRHQSGRVVAYACLLLPEPGVEQTLSYAPPMNRRPSQILAWAADLTCVYPLVMLAFLYVEWGVAAVALGHVPRPSLDDPKDIAAIQWLHVITGMTLVGLLPVGLAAMVFNVLYVVHSFSTQRMVIRALLVLFLWLGTSALLRWDPGQVVYWWLD